MKNDTKDRGGVDIKFLCNKCGKEQPRDEKQSNENWNVYPTNQSCNCGGKFYIKIV